MKIKELKVGEFYEDRLSGRIVQILISEEREADDIPTHTKYWHCSGEAWNNITGYYDLLILRDNQLRSIETSI